MKKWLWFSLLLFTTPILSACTQPVETAQRQQSQKAEPKKITPREAKEMMDPGGVTVVDVRTPEEYRQAHIPGAVLVPVDSITGEAPGALPEKNAVLLVYCRTGVRSANAAKRLTALGYTKVYDFGGIVDWPYETVTEVDGDDR